MKPSELGESIRRAESIWSKLGREQKKGLLEPLHARVEGYYERVFGRAFDSFPFVSSSLRRKELSHERLNDLFKLVQNAWSEAFEQEQKDRKQ